MTLGGLALSVGILVDDATVTIENINCHLEQGNEVEQAILEGAHQIALPALVSTLSICIVFVPMFQLAGIAKVPVHSARRGRGVRDARLLYPVANPDPHAGQVLAEEKRRGQGPQQIRLARFQERFERGFERMRHGYRELLALAIDGGMRFAGVFLLAMAAAALIAFPIGPLPGLGQDFFPTVDAGQLKLHFRAPTGTRIEETAILCDQVEKTIRETIKPGEITSIVDNLGLPYSGINLSYSTSAPVGPGDADIFINFAEKHSSRRLSARAAREAHGLLPLHAIRISAGGHRQPDSEFRSALAASTCRSPARIPMRIACSSRSCCRSSSAYPGAVDLHIQQPYDYPQINVDVDRTKATFWALPSKTSPPTC